MSYPSALRLSMYDRHVKDRKEPSHPPGHQPYDALNGMRVGAITGGVLGAAVAAVTHIPWFVLLGGVIGGVIGFVYARRTGSG